MEPQAKYSKQSPGQPQKQATMEMFYNKLVHDDTKSKEQEAPTSGVHNRGDTAEKDDVTILSNENTEAHPVGSEGQLKCNSEAGDACTLRDPGGEFRASQAEACSFDIIDGRFHLLCMLRHKTGDLFSSPDTDSLAHCVSQDLGMGKGIAVLFKKTFGGVEELKSQNKEVGDVAVLKRGHRFVYYLITKKKYWGKPTYKTLKDSLLSMRQHIQDNGVRDLSMPRIGCGLDKLQWSRVELMLKEIFEDMELTITIYSLE